MQIFAINNPNEWYHGSRTRFNAFAPFSWFFKDRQEAFNYVSVATQGLPSNLLYTVQLSVKNTLDLSQWDADDLIVDEFETTTDFDALCSDLTLSTDEVYDLAPHLGESMFGDIIAVVKPCMKRLQEKGFDSLAIRERGFDSICVFNPEDITILGIKKVGTKGYNPMNVRVKGEQSCG